MQPICSECGKPLGANGVEGLCPECLIKVGLGSQTDAGGPQDSSSRFTPPKPEDLAARFPQLEILELIGRGGMGAVYKARQKQLDRIVALKILPPGIGEESAFAERFAREARALAKLNHPGVVTLYEFGVAAGVSPAVEPGVPPGGKASDGSPPVQSSSATLAGKPPPPASGQTAEAPK